MLALYAELITYSLVFDQMSIESLAAVLKLRARTIRLICVATGLFSANSSIVMVCQCLLNTDIIAMHCIQINIELFL